MLLMMKKGSFLVGIITILFLTPGCSTGTSSSPLSTLTIAPPQNPYQSKTSTPVIPSATVPIPTEQPLIPTATPFKHAVQPGDTLYGIAIQFNISLDKLVSANPGVNTSILSIGTELVIPFSEEDELSVPTPTPYPIPVSDPVCYSSKDGGVWCVAMVKNNQNVVLENISIAFNLYNQDQGLIQSIVAIPPLNTLYPDQSIPLAAHISPAEMDQYQISATLLTALPSERSEPLTVIADYSIQYSQGNKIAEIKGIVEALETETEEDQVWIAAVAFSEGNPVGIRKWISQKPILAGTVIPFEILLYSLGPRIDQVLLLSELH